MRHFVRHRAPEFQEHSLELSIGSTKPSEVRKFSGMSLELATSDEQEYLMGATTDKIKGHANEAIGKAKQGIGEATGSERLQGEGLIQEGKGHAQKAVGDAKQAAKNAADKASDFANRKL